VSLAFGLPSPRERSASSALLAGDGDLSLAGVTDCAEAVAHVLRDLAFRPGALPDGMAIIVATVCGVTMGVQIWPRRIWQTSDTVTPNAAATSAGCRPAREGQARLDAPLRLCASP
jgi:hypothetical protein